MHTYVYILILYKIYTPETWIFGRIKFYVLAINYVLKKYFLFLFHLSLFFPFSLSQINNPKKKQN